MATSMSLHALAAPGHSMVCRVTTNVLAGASALPGFWCAYYSARVMDNGWEPFDQPTPSSYMPCPYRAFEVMRLGGGGALLVERTPRPSRAVLRRSHPGLISTFMESLDIADVASLIGTLLVPFDLSHAERMVFSDQTTARA